MFRYHHPFDTMCCITVVGQFARTTSAASIAENTWPVCVAMQLNPAFTHTDGDTANMSVTAYLGDSYVFTASYSTTINVTSPALKQVRTALIVCVPVNQEVVYISVIYGMFAYASPVIILPRKFFYFLFQTSQRRHLCMH